MAAPGGHISLEVQEELDGFAELAQPADAGLAFQPERAGARRRMPGRQPRLDLGRAMAGVEFPIEGQQVAPIAIGHHHARGGFAIAPRQRLVEA